MRGAGGSDGGIGRFLIGTVMLISGGYLLLTSIRVDSGWGVGGVMYDVGGYGVGGGTILLPFVLGIGMIFYNGKNPIGWLLGIGSVIALIVGVIANVQFRFANMTLFSLLTILILTVGGIGLLLSSLRGLSEQAD